MTETNPHLQQQDNQSDAQVGQTGTTGQNPQQSKKKSAIDLLLHPDIHSFFHYSSKIVIAVPVAIIIISLGFYAYNLYKARTGSITARVTFPTNVPSPTSRPQDPMEDISKLFGGLGGNGASSRGGQSMDLDGTYACVYSDEDMSLNVSVNKGEAYVEMTTKATGELDYILLKDDCIHKWEKNATTGEKMCGVSSLLSMYKMASRFGNFDSSILKMLPSLGMDVPTDETKLEAIKESCEDDDSIDLSQYKIPANVTFSEMSMENLSVPGIPSQGGE